MHIFWKGVVASVQVHFMLNLLDITS